MATPAFGEADGLPVPQHVSGRRLAEPGKHAQQRGFSAAGRTEQGNDLAGFDFEIVGRDDFNAAPVRLDVELLDSLGANDGHRSRVQVSR